MYLAVDPGERNIGWARFDETGELTGIGTFRSIDEFADWLDMQPPPKTIIVEGYWVNPNKHKSWSKATTVECIGILKRWGRKHSCNLVEQRNTILSIGLRYLGMYDVYYTGRKLTKHIDDEIAALAHGEYYLVSQGIKKNRIAKEK